MAELMVLGELAQATGAKSIAIPAMRLYARCEQNKKTVRDASTRGARPRGSAS